MTSERQAYIPEHVILAMGKATGAQWGVLAALYLHANEAGEAWPSIGTLGEITGHNRRTVVRALNDLERLIGLRKVRPAKRGTRETTRYLLPTRGAATPSHTEVGAREVTTRGADVHQVGVLTPPKQGLNTSEQSGEAPPYALSGRGGYRREMSDEEHERSLKTMKSLDLSFLEESGR